MKRIHPNFGHTAVLVALAFLVAAGGCKNQSGGIGNPFLAPDRVPPPATRALLPGQAQPYYPGDPLPMQSKTEAAGSASVAASEPQMPSADTNLAWNSPRSAAAPSAPSDPAERPAIASAESSVAIPADGDSLRFALPQPVEPEQFSPAAPAPLNSPQQTTQVAAAPPAQVVVPASYNAPINSSTPAMVSSPWRTPEVAQPFPAPPNYAPQLIAQPMIAQPAPSQPIILAAPPLLPMDSVSLAAASYPMDVRLRAVPSPPDPYSATPRIRLPGYAAPPSVSSDDGFRARTSMK